MSINVIEEKRKKELFERIENKTNCYFIDEIDEFESLEELKHKTNEARKCIKITHDMLCFGANLGDVISLDLENIIYFDFIKEDRDSEEFIEWIHEELFGEEERYLEQKHLEELKDNYYKSIL